MNPQKIASVNERLKGGTEVIFNGGIAWVEHDEQGDYINLRTTKEKQHKVDNTFLILRSEISVAPKYRTTLKVVAKAPTTDDKAEKKDLNSFFDSLGAKIPFNCNNCRLPLYAINKPTKRSVCAHIFPKAYFKSIAKNPDNIMFLGASFIGCPCGCHDSWDRNLDSRKKMHRAYDLAIKRFELLKPFMTDKEIVMANDYLGLEVSYGN